MKKGRSSWRPAAALDLLRKAAGFRYRWCDKDRMNIDKKLAEGWQFANADKAESVGVLDGQPVTSTTEYRELVVMRLPEELGQARDEYFSGQADAAERAIKRKAQEDLSKEGAAQVHGKVTIIR